MIVFVTNLPSATERRRHIAGQIAAADLDHEFVDCVIGNELSDEEIAAKCDIDRIREFNQNVEWMNRGMIGCSLTSQNVHRSILERDLDFAMLLEDDTILPGNLKEILSECEAVLQPGDVALLFWLASGTARLLGRSKIELPSVDLYEVEDPGSIHGGSATIFTKEAARRILSYNSPIRTTPDSWNEFIEAGCIDRLLLAYPMVVDTADFMSTMELGRFVPLRRLINRYRLFPFYQILRKRRLRAKKSRQRAVVLDE